MARLSLIALALCFAIVQSSSTYANPTEYRPSACEACEIALEEGLEKVVRLLKGQDDKVRENGRISKNVELHLEFPAMAEDMNVWRKYSKVHYDNLFKNYLDKHTVADHWKSIEMKFSGSFGARDLNRRAVAEAKRAPGSLGWSHVWALKENECIKLSGFCKGSRLRVPRRPLTACGVCRETIRDVMIDVRRLWDAPAKATMGSLDEALENVCAKMPARHSPKRAKYLEEACTEIMIEEHGDSLGKKLWTRLQAAEPSWAKLGPSGKFSNDLEEAICGQELGLCGKDEL